MGDSSNFKLRLFAAAVTIVCANQAMAQEAESAKTESGKSTSISSTTSIGSDNIFTGASGAAQQMFIPSYASGGGRLPQTGVLTAPARGLPIVMGGVYLYPAIGVSLGNNSNVLGTSANEVSSQVTNIRPELVFEFKSQGDRYTASYFGNYSRYSNSSADNSNQYEFQFAGDNIIDSKTKFGWLAGYNETIDPRGGTDRGVSATPDKWNSPTLAALFSYGSPGAMGRIELEGTVQNKRYENNRALTAASDVNLAGFAGRFFYRVAPKTSLLFELKQNNANYLLPSSLNDNVETRFMFGATWELTAATTGYFKVGYLSKDFKTPSRETFSSMSWDGRIRWMPLSYSSVDLLTSKSTADSTGFGDFLLNRSFNLFWNHRWIGNWGTKVSAGWVKSSYMNTLRKDDLRTIGVGVTYDVKRWLRMGLEFNNTQRNSTLNINDFGRNVVFFTLDATL